MATDEEGNIAAQVQQGISTLAHIVGGSVAPRPGRTYLRPRLCGVPRPVQDADGKKRFELIDPERVYEDSYMLHLYAIAERVVRSQQDWAIGDSGDTAVLFVRVLLDRLKPRDPIEEMLVLQMIYTHLRLGRLSKVASDQERTENVRVINEACDRAASTFRRQMLALAEYRRPPRQKVFIAAEHANISEQQVVQENANYQILAIENEQGCPTPGRPYCLTPTGLKALQAAASRTQPWRRSTGPRTVTGKQRSRMNALKLGLYTREMLADRRELAQLERMVREEERPKPLELDPRQREISVDRIVAEMVKLLD
jgi:hypothetical protein